jgi:hypothetical protein
VIQLDYQPPQPPLQSHAGATLRFSMGVGLGFAAIGVAIFYSGGDACCGLIGLCISVGVAVGIFHAAGRFRRRRDPSGWVERKPIWTFFIGVGCFAAAALGLYLLHFISENLAVRAFFVIGAALSIASPWIVFRRE